MTVEALRLELRTRNNRLWHLVFDEYPSVASFARAHGVSHFRVGSFLNLTESPYLRNGEPCPLALTLSILAGCAVEALFPRELYRRECPRRLVAEVPAHALRSLESASTLALPPAQEDDRLRVELADRLRFLMRKYLNRRERQVLEMRFGLGSEERSSSGDAAMTYEEIAQALGRSRGRVAQVAEIAMAKLRRGPRGKFLEPFLE